jgi:HAD superfamily hydrolase (TIGR01509 family)
LKAYIFDLDGTLLDSLDCWDKIDKEFLESRNLIAPDYREAIRVLSYSETAEYTAKRFGLTETPEELMAEWTRMAESFYRHEAKLKPYAKEYLRSLKDAGALIGVATSNSEDLFKPALASNGVLELFDAFATTFEVSRGKSDPDVFLLAAEKLGAKPEDCIVFEDTPEGIKSAKQANMAVYGVYEESWKNHWDYIKELADGVIYDFSEAPLPLA